MSCGMGDYVNQFPCAYGQVYDPGSALPMVLQSAGMSGLGLYLPADYSPYPEMLRPKGLGCGCAGGCGLFGLTMDGTGLLGTGLFSGGADLSTWGIGEYAVLAFGAYAVWSLVSDVKTGAGKVRKRMRRKKVAKA